MKKFYIINLIVAGLICAVAMILASSKGLERGVSISLPAYYLGGSLVVLLLSFFLPKMNARQEIIAKKWLFICFDMLATASVVAILNDHLVRKIYPILAVMTIGGLVCLAYVLKQQKALNDEYGKSVANPRTEGGVCDA